MEVPLSPTIYPSIDYVLKINGEIVDSVPEGFIVRLPDDNEEDGWTYGIVKEKIVPKNIGPIGFLPSRIITRV